MIDQEPYTYKFKNPGGKHSSEYWQGKSARENDLPQSTNPYPDSTSRRWREWDYGWRKVPTKEIPIAERRLRNAAKQLMD